MTNDRRGFPAGVVALVVLVSALTLAGCSTSAEKRWVKNAGEGLFTRIPAEWESFVIDPYKVDSDRLKPVKRTPQRWQLLFDSAKGSSRETARQHLEADLPAKPVGELSVQPLPLPDRFGDADLRAAMSLDLMRRFAFFEFKRSPAPDPATAPEELLAANTGTNELAPGDIDIDVVASFNSGDPSVELLSYEEYPNTRKFPGSPEMRGLRIRFNYEIYDDRWVTVDQKILHNPKTDKILRLVVKCEASCFHKNEKTIDSIMDSFTIKK